MAKLHILKAVKYGEIKSYSMELMKRLKHNDVPLELDEFPLFIKINCGDDPDSLEALIKAATESKEIVAVLGIDKKTNKFKVSFLALGKDGKIDPRHLMREGALPGQETWPPIGNYPKVSSDDPLSTIEPIHTL